MMPRTARMQVYVNGKLDNGVFSGDDSCVAACPRRRMSTLVSGLARPGQFNFAGVLDDVRIYNRALSQAEIQADMGTPMP